MSDIQSKYNNEKLKTYEQEQNVLMLQAKDDRNNLEYLRGAELHQTRQELMFIMQKINELQADNQHLRQQCKLQELDHETYNKSLKEEYQRLLREVSQHKVLFDQRSRELKQLKTSSDHEKSEYDSKLEENCKIRDETMTKLSTISEQLASLRSNYEDLKRKYDDTYSENETITENY
eukprot:TRINITY_DN22727_c0_g1_i1.p1 TRINITY_DN22727_c0_g1~~TRINITY_DN22727_c0_g1_i1.p1  ORF type:complete len:206 (-),score=25.77 TRINITY_DN22727_c0_g1_i1:294-824(-)